MLLQDGEDHDRTALPVDGEGFAGLKPVLRHDRWVFDAQRRLEARGPEAIAEAGAQRL